MVWKCLADPADTKEDKGTGLVGRGLGKRMGVFLQGVTASFLIKDTFGHDDGNLAIVWEFFG
jgi:hypothetical protein